MTRPFALTVDPVRPPVRLRFCTLGAALVHVGEAQVTPASGILFALLVRLAHSPGMAVTRDQLVAELWPGHDSVRQRANLRQALYKLRSIGVRVDIGRAVVALDSAQVAPTFALDRTAARFRAQVLAGGEPFGPFLPGVVAERGEWAEWVDVQRGVVHGEVRHVLVTELRERRQAGDWGGTEAVARALLRFDPLNEEATLMLAECIMLVGAKTEAVALLDRYLEELGEVPAELRGRALAMRQRFQEPPPRVTRVREREAEERHFVGRAEELAQLALGVRRARWQDGAGVLVHGAPGIGKTRLAQELSQVAAGEGFQEVRAACREGDDQSQFQLLATLVPRLLALPGALGCEPDSMQRLRQQWPGGEGGAAGVRGAGRPAPGAGGAAPVDEVLATVVQQAGMREALVDLLAAVTEERPLLLVVEDIHWLDAGSWQVLQLFVNASASCRLFLLFTSRERAPASLREVTPAPRLALLPLAPLPPDEVRRLAEAVSAEYVAELPASVQARLAAASEGNPLFLRALIKHWVDTGEAEGIPGTLQALLDTRVTRLHPTTLTVLQAIVLLGPLASAERVRGAVELGTAALLGALDELEVADCIRSVPPHHVASHDLVGQAARARLSPAAAAVLHGAVADVLREEHGRTREGALLLPLLEQLLGAGRVTEACALLAGEEEGLLGQGNPAPVLRLAERLEAMAAGTTAQPAVRAVLAQLQSQAGNYLECLRLAGGVAQLPVDEATLDEGTAAGLLTFLESAYRSDVTHDVEYAAETITRLCELEQLSPRLRLEAARCGLVIATNQAAPTLARRCFTVIGALGAAEDTRYLRMMYHTSFGDIDEARALALALAAEAPPKEFNSRQVQMFGNVAYALRLCGESESAVNLFEQCFSSAVQLSLPRLADFSSLQLATIHLSSGDEISFAYWTNKLRELYSDSSDPLLKEASNAFLLRVSIRDRDRDEALYRYDLHNRTVGANATRQVLSFSSAVSLGVGLLDPSWTPDQSQLSVAVERFVQIAQHVSCDFYLSAILDGLMRAKRVSEAADLATRFMVHWRRQREPVYPELKRSLMNIPGFPSEIIDRYS